MDQRGEIFKSFVTYVNNSNETKNKVKIPKIIMQTWKNNNIPEKWKKSPESIAKIMPDWNYVLMTDHDNREFVKLHFPDFLSYYDSFTYNIQRADAIRYMWLYVHGGLYIDLDYEILKPLDELFQQDSDLYLVASGNIGGYITNSFMAAKPKCTLWLDILERMKHNAPWYAFGKHLYVMSTTGPIMLTDTVRNTNTAFTMLPRVKITPCSVCNIHCVADDAYVKQLPGSSWITYDTQIYTFFMCHWRKVILGILLIILILFILIISKEMYNKYV